MVPYREHELPPAPRAALRELVYRPLPKNGHASARRMYVRWFVFVLPLALLLAAYHWAASLALVAIVLAWDAARVRRERAGILLRLDDATLAVFPEGKTKGAQAIPMAKLRNVRLDTRAVSSTGTVVRADGVLASGPALAVDESRIELVLAGAAQPMRLTEAYYSHHESLEWLGKIRSFLRSRGWVPEDERAHEGQRGGAS